MNNLTKISNKSCVFYRPFNEIAKDTSLDRFFLIDVDLQTQISCLKNQP